MVRPAGSGRILFSNNFQFSLLSIFANASKRGQRKNFYAEREHFRRKNTFFSSILNSLYYLCGLKTKVKQKQHKRL